MRLRVICYHASIDNNNIVNSTGIAAMKNIKTKMKTVLPSCVRKLFFKLVVKKPFFSSVILFLGPQEALNTRNNETIKKMTNTDLTYL